VGNSVTLGVMVMPLVIGVTELVEVRNGLGNGTISVTNALGLLRWT
jgi:hypothetical protein